MIRTAKRNLEKKLATENGGNSKPFFAYLKSKTKSKTAVSPLLDGIGQVIADKKGMAAQLNQYFASVFTREPPRPVPEPDRSNCENELQQVDIDEDMVVKKIKALKSASAPGPMESAQWC
jgi:hypothetical protein